MPKKSFLSLLSFLIVGTVANCQDLSLWSKDTLDLANTAASAPYLTLEEKKVIQLINLARLNGNAFLKRVAMPYVKENNKDDDDFVEGLYSDLRVTYGLHLLHPHEKLHQSSAHHAHDMGTKGQVGHDSSDGTPFTVRIHRFHKPVHVSENCVYGYADAYSNVMEMLIDEAVPDRTHRHNILGKSFHLVGVSIKPHKMIDFNCVVDFAAE